MRDGAQHAALERLYETADGWLHLAVVKEEEFEALGKALGIDVRSDERFATPQARWDNDYQLVQVISTDQILAWAGYSPEAVAELRSRNVTR